MAGAKVNNYSIGDSNIESVMLTTDQIYKGKSQISLTEMSTTTVPKIAAGSWIENNGTLFKFDSDETLTGSPSDGIVYIRIVPSTTTCTAELTNTAPTWSDSKQGWYGTSTYANYRYLPFWMVKSSAVYWKSNKIHSARFVNHVSGVFDGSVGTQSGITTGTYTRDPVLVDGIDALGEISSSGITISKPGLYRLYGQVNMSADDTDSATTYLALEVRLYIDSVYYETRDRYACYGNAAAMKIRFQHDIYLNAGQVLSFKQYYELFSTHSCSASWYNDNGANFSLEMI